MSPFPARRDLATRKWWTTKLLRHFLPIGFLIAVLIGMLWPWPGTELSSIRVGDYRVATVVHLVLIFVIAGLTLDTKEALKAFKRPAGLVTGLVCILGITPMLSFAATHIPFTEPAFAVGFAVFCAMPTTLSSGHALVVAARGNGALALVLTVGSNLLGIVTVPFLLKGVFASMGAVKLAPLEILKYLLLNLLVPLAVGKAVQMLWARARAFSERHARPLMLFSNFNIVLILWETISRAQTKITRQPAGQLALVILAAIAVHAVFLAVSGALGKLVVRLPLPEFKAVLITGSQKTLPIAITVIGFLDPLVFGDHDLIAVPCIIGHLAQLFIDAFMITQWNAFESSHAEKAAADAEDTLTQPSTNAESTDCDAAKGGNGASTSGPRDTALEMHQWCSPRASDGGHAPKSGEAQLQAIAPPMQVA